MIKLDYSNVLSERIGKEHGISLEEIESFQEQIPKIEEEINLRKDIDFYFMNIPFQNLERIKEIGKNIRENFEYFVVIGIGGSALGNQTLNESINSLDYNYKKYPKFFVLDNVDPEKFSFVLEQIDLKRTVFNIITKSGSTTETVANFLVILNMLKSYVGENWKKHLIITTDRQRGFLRKFADQEGIISFDIPQNLGGRFSVLSNVGLLSAISSGIDAEELLEGSRYAYTVCSNPKILENPAYLIGIIHYIANTKKGKSISVMMSYSERLSLFVDWYRQLWAESLGKEGLGQTPVKAIGSIDQHSQIQLYIDGPKDKIVTFLKVESVERDFMIEGYIPPELEYLKGKSLKQILDALMEGTKTALIKASVPNLTISIERLTPYSIGMLIYIYEMATGFSGLLYGINPFDQPAVEEGKNFAYGLMGREGFEEKLQEYNLLNKSSFILEV